MIRCEALSLRAGEFAFDGIDLDIPHGKHAVLMGRTGCGKSTLLETVCGLRAPARGRIQINGADVTTAPPAARGIGYVPQDGALFRKSTVRGNLGFALRMRRAPRAEIDARVAELAALLDLESLLDRYPTTLSGGERQRTALGRALAFRPSVLCLDEPLSAIDDAVREEMYAAIETAREHSAATVLHVTHSRAEAKRLADIRFEMRADGIARV